MARTFMFNVDRFTPTDNFAATYRNLGGTTLSEHTVQHLMRMLYTRVLTDYENPLYTKRFPSLRDYLETYPAMQDLPRSEKKILEQVFALHEVGEIPVTHAEILRQLRQTHRLGVVSDIWSTRKLFLQEFDRAGVRDLFDVIIFSADHGRVKPSAYLFTKAMESFAAPRQRIVFVGDSFYRDIRGAKAVGLSTIWIHKAGGARADQLTQADAVMQDLCDLPLL